MIEKLDIPSLIFGAILGSVLSIWLDLYIKRPKLLINGSGSGNFDNGLYRNSISIHNKVGWFGLNIPETRIFGIRIHPFWRLGLSFQKADANNCRAYLYLVDTKEAVAPLWWLNNESSVTDVKSIRSGDSSTLLLFVAQSTDGRYFPYQPADRETGLAKLPIDLAYFSGTKNFYIQVHYSYNQTLKFPVTISEKFDGKLYLETKNSSIFLLGR